MSRRTRGEIREERAQEELAAGQHPAGDEDPHVGSQLLVEEVLELERAPARAGVGRIERRLGVTVLDGLDDPRRIADCHAVELQYGERRRAGEAPRDRPVASRLHRASHMGDALVIERPAHLLVVVRHLEVPEDGRRAHLRIVGCAQNPRALSHADTRRLKIGAVRSSGSACPAFGTKTSDTSLVPM